MVNASTTTSPENQYRENVISSTRKILTIVFFMILILTCLVGNALMCILFFRYRRLRIISNYFIISLAVSDLLVGVLAMPIWISLELTGWTDLPRYINIRTMITAWQCLDIFCCISSIVNLSAVSVERFFSIYKPLQHRNLMTVKNTYFLILMFWMYSLLITLLQLIKSFKEHYLIFIFIMGFMCPLITIFVSYIGISCASSKHQLKIRKSSEVFKTKNEEITVTKSLLLVTTVFVVCWTPFFIYALLHRYCFICRFIDTSESKIAERLIKWLHYSNSAANPIIYGMFNQNFREVFKKLIARVFKGKMIPRRESTMTNTTSSRELRSNMYDRGKEYPISYHLQCGELKSSIREFSRFKGFGIEMEQRDPFRRLSVSFPRPLSEIFNYKERINRKSFLLKPMPYIKENENNIAFEEFLCNDTFDINERLFLAQESNI